MHSGAADAEMTTLVLPIPEADDAVQHWRRNHDWSARAGVPAHITLLGPFLPPETIGPQTAMRLRSLFASWQPVRFSLATVERLSGVVYLAPEPAAPFRQLTEMLEREWPEAPHFGAAFGRPLHHLTVARNESVYDEVKEELGGRLPIDAVTRESLLFEKRTGVDVRLIGRFPIGR